MVPSIYGENMFDDFFDNSFFGGHFVIIPPVKVCQKVSYWV